MTDYPVLRRAEELPLFLELEFKMNAPKFKGFEILEVMPQGAMGTVYKARQISLDRLVALKALHGELAKESADLEQFLAEAKITANLKHQNIVQVYDFGKTDEGVYFFVMEFVSGYSVGEWIRRKKCISEENSLLVAQSVAAALEYAWDKDGVIHCDIKPDNIMIDSDGTVKVADLGLARSIGSVVDHAKAEHGVVCGTPNYISPEQSKGDTVLDLRSDIYSLGAMLYHCVTGKMPFEGEPYIKVMDLQISHHIPDPQDVNPAVSGEAAFLIEKMMAKNRINRQPTWAAVQEDLNRVLNNKMPVGIPLEEGVSTVLRSAERGTRQHVKAHHIKPRVKTEHLASYEDNIEFNDMERQFERKQKQRLVSSSEMWVAGAIGLAVVILAVLMFRSLFDKSTPDKKRTTPRSASSTVVETESDSTLSDEERRVNNARRMYQEAMNWMAQNRGRYDEAIAVFEQLANDAEGTEYSEMARGEIRIIQDAKFRTIGSVWLNLEDQAKELWQHNRYDEAIQLLTHYNGPMAAETSEKRQALAAKWREKRTLTQNAEREAARFKEIVSDVAVALVNGDPASALEYLRDNLQTVKSDEAGNELGKLSVVLAEAAQMEKRILDTFRAQLNREATLMLKSGAEKLIIREVGDNKIEVEKIIISGDGHIGLPKTLGLKDFAHSELHVRLGGDDRPEIALMKGLVIVRDGDLKSAEPFFARTGPVLASALLEEIKEREQFYVEEQSKKTFVWILRSVQVDVPDEVPQVEECVSLVRQKNFTSKDKEFLGKAVSAYRQKFEATDFAAKYERVLKSLENVVSGDREESSLDQPDRRERRGDSSRVRTVDNEPLRRILLERNPGLTPDDIRFGADADGKIVSASLCSPALRDIQPLQMLRDLQQLVCSGRSPGGHSLGSENPARLTDISVLKGMPLRELNLSYTEIRDLSVLSGMPLEKLNISFTRVQDVQPLAGMSLNDLDLSGSLVRDIRALQGMPLESLNINATAVDSIMPLRDMRLLTFNAGGTRIRQILALRGMPLESLNINDTGVGDVSILRGMPLKNLEIARTQIRDLTPLSGVPLEFLDVGGMNMRGLSALVGMRLQSLRADNNRITDLSPLDGMPLRSLFIQNTDVKSLAVLRSLPVTVLRIDATKVDSLAELQGMMLEDLSISGTGVKDLTALVNMPLRRLDISGTDVHDISPLRNMPIEHIRLDRELLRAGGRDRSREPVMHVLRRMPKLQTVNGLRLFDH